MEGKYVIESVRRSLKVLKIFSDGESEYGISELSKIGGIPKSSILRILSTLESEGFVILDENTKKYRLGLYFNSIAASIGYSALKHQLHPDLSDAAEKSGMLVHFTVLDGERLFILSRVYPQNITARLAFQSEEGGEVPLNATGAGKVIAAFSPPDISKRLLKLCPFDRYSGSTITGRYEFLKCLEETRRLGYALNIGEHEAYLACLSRPIFYANGKLVGAISFSGFKEMFEGTAFHRLDEVSMRTVERISRRLGYEKEALRGICPR